MRSRCLCVACERYLRASSSSLCTCNTASARMRYSCQALGTYTTLTACIQVAHWYRVCTELQHQQQWRISPCLCAFSHSRPDCRPTAMTCVSSAVHRCALRVQHMLRRTAQGGSSPWVLRRVAPPRSRAQQVRQSRLLSLWSCCNSPCLTSCHTQQRHCCVCAALQVAYHDHHASKHQCAMQAATQWTP
jgi:hypothetical protein